MGIEEGGGKQKKKEIGLVAKNAVYGKWVGGGAEGEAQRQDCTGDTEDGTMKSSYWKKAVNESEG